MFRTALFLVGMLGSGLALAFEELPTITVTASTSDGQPVALPFFLINAAQMKYTARSPYRLPDTDGYVSMTKAEFCAALSNSKPDNCSMLSYPATPWSSSSSGASWSGNGCGADPWSTAFGAGYLSLKYGSLFSGDLNRPVAGNPGIDFTSICNNHDRCYTTPNRAQSTCDGSFATSLNNFCTNSTDPTNCSKFDTDYKQAVTDYGADAFDEDQTDLKCGSWGAAMKDDRCG
jgi:hypothetical protein